MCYSLFDFSLVLLLRVVVVVVVVVIVVRFFLLCPVCRRVPVSRDARSGFKNRHTRFFFVQRRETNTQRMSFSRSPRTFFFQTSINKKLTFFFG